MKNNEVVALYTFLGNGIKMSALSEEKTRDSILKLIRELRKASTQIFDELKVSEEPAFSENQKEVQEKVLNEECTVEFTKLDEDVLLTAIAESKIDVPVLAVLNSFKELIKD